MARYTPKNFGGDLAPLNPEFEKIAQAIMDTLSRKGDTPNGMVADLDMNSQRILNLPAPLSTNEPARLKDVQDVAQTLPDQTGNQGKSLKTDGSVATWQPAVDSFKGRTGEVQPQASDYDASQVDSTNGDVQSDLNSLGSRLDDIDSQNLDSRLSTAEQDINTLESQNLDSRLTTAEGNINSNDTDISDLQSVDLQRKTLEKLKRDAVFYADFTKDEAIVASDLSKTAQGVAAAITYTAPDGQTGITADSRVATAGVDEPAIVYRDGECQGLQVVPSSTNLVFPSEDMNISSTTKTSNFLILGDVSLSRYVEDTATNNRNIAVYTGANAGTHSLSCIFKPISAGSERFLILSDPTQSEGAYINCTTLEIGVSDFVFTKLEPLSGGAYRFTVTITNVQSGDTLVARMRDSPSYFAGNYTGDGISGLILGAVKIEQGYPTPYIPTTTSQVTRGDTFATGDGIDKYQEFTIFIDVNPTIRNDGNWNNLIGFNKTSNPGTRGIGLQLNNTSIRGAFRTDSVSSYNEIPLTIDSLSKLKALLTYDGSTAKVAANGSVSSFSVSGDITDFIESVFIGNIAMGGSGGYEYNKFSSVSVIPYAVTDVEAIALTTLEE